MKLARSDYDQIQDPRHKIPCDEPVFLLRGQDAAAPAAVEAWANLADAHGADKSIVDKARYQACLMRQWHAAVEKKTPDL